MSVVGQLNGKVNVTLEPDDQNTLSVDTGATENEQHIHTDTEQCIKDHGSSIVDGENVCLQSTSSSLGNNSFVVKVPRANSKLILQNMEEVLNSVKKKHRQKHRRKKEQKKLALLAEADREKVAHLPAVTISECNPNDSIVLSTSSIEKDNIDCYKSRQTKKVKKPLQEQQAVQDQSSQSNHMGKGKHHNTKRRKTSISPLKSNPAETGGSANSLLNHLIRTPRKNDVEGNTNQNPAPGSANVNQNSTPSLKPATNAFEVMMNARNKSIGSNTPGKEATLGDDTAAAASNAVNAKRKLLLQSWAERKGSLKRKLDEEMRAAYIEERLDCRAKRLKKMLTAGGSPRGTNTSKATTSEQHSKNDQDTASNTKCETKQRRQTSSRRSRRLSSADSTEPEIQHSLDPETEEFLSKLSSPTKKRDSLFGYFSKIPSPNEISAKSGASTPLSHKVAGSKKQQKAAKNESETPKRRGRPSKPLPPDLSNVPVRKSAENIECPAEVPKTQTETPTGRPKRACAEKAKYDYDLDVSPKKEQKLSRTLTRHSTDDCAVIATDNQRRSKRKQRRASSVSNDDDDVLVINLDSSSSFSISKEVSTKTPKKLAPLFVRSVPKPSLDPEALKARQEFLRSGVPDKLKLEQDKQRLYEQNYEDAIELFPKISHLQQWSYDDEKFLTEFSLDIESFRFKNINESFDASHDTSNETRSRSNNNIRRAKANKARSLLIGITSCTARDFRPDKKATKSANPLDGLVDCLPVVNNKRLIIKSWKTDFDRFPTYKCYNQLRTKYRFFSALDSAQDTEQVTESFVVTRSTRRSLEASALLSAAQSNADILLEEEVKPPPTAPNGELLFTEKYKPMLFQQVLVNLTPVSQLRDFLAIWANGSIGGSAKNSQNLMDDSMDFINDSSSSQQATCNSVVLLGPASSGKTNAVFTLANEMNFNVLEINAGMKRTGKKLIQELLEATQSHQIRNESTGGSAVKSKAQKNLLKMSLNSLKGRKHSSNNNSVTEIDMSAESDLNVRKCLILIEDADIVFEQTDAGFTDAVYTLAASSKRPVIIVATNPNCQHLQRLMTQNTIKFTTPNALSISKYLAVLSLMENCPVSLDDLISLYLYNQQDLRKTLHELQFFVQSGGDRTRQSKNAENMSNGQGGKKQQQTPQKDSEHSEVLPTGKYFASPGKRRLSEETLSISGAVHDEQLKREAHQQHQSSLEELYLHRTLFEFYTVDQNAKWRIPFPVNFDLFYINLSDIFAVSKRLKPVDEECEVNGNTSKRKTRSPKKVWLSTATANEVQTDKQRGSQVPESLDALWSFYNNVSIANLIAAQGEGYGYTAKKSRQERDRLMPYLSESIAHDILEHTINFNLEAELCPYNLFERQKKSATLCELMSPTAALFSKRARFLDFEPTLRSICRSEQQRAAQERRSTRFYHYLRNSCADMCNLSQKHFDSMCDVFQTQQEFFDGDNSNTFVNIQ